MAQVENVTTSIRPLPVPGNLPPPSNLQAAHTQLVARLLSIRPPAIVGEADGPDIRALSDYLVAIADAVDPLIEAIGREAKSHSCADHPVKFDAASFRKVIYAAIDGNATFTLHALAEAIDENPSPPSPTRSRRSKPFTAKASSPSASSISACAGSALTFMPPMSCGGE